MTDAIGPRLGAGKEAEVFDYEGHVLKLYRNPAAKPSAFREAATLSIIERARPAGCRARSASAPSATDGVW